MSVALCIFAFLVVAFIARKSLVGGIATTLAVGYSYGIVRANLDETMAHFIFDGAVVGLYLGRVFAARRPDTIKSTQLLRPWLVVLIGWPILLTLLPIQDPMVQLVGLRGSVFLLPMVLLGAHLREDDLNRLVWTVAVLNVVALGFAVLEFFIGLESFYPRSEVTELIFDSRVGDASMSYRIPATFVNAHAYAGTMVCTLPIIVHRWMGTALDSRRRFVLVMGLASAIVGVFMSATRTHAIVLFVLVVVATLSLRVRPSRLAVWMLILGLAGWIVWQDARLQRFATLSDTDYVSRRFEGSVNETFFTLVLEYPMGNGIGGGGTSLPYFLAGQVSTPVAVENEYGRILLELGVPGLILWVSFSVWVVASGFRRSIPKENLGRRLAFTAAITYMLVGTTGIGMFTSIPQSALLLLLFGWVVRLEPGIGPSSDLSAFSATPRGTLVVPASSGSHVSRVR